MATLTLGGKTVLTQTGSDEPVLGSNLTGSPNLTGSNFDLSSSTFPAGHIIQIVQKTDTDNTTFDVGPSSKTNTPFDNLNCSITPLKTNSKILITLNISVGHQDNDTCHIDLVRNPTGSYVRLANGPADGSTTSATFSVRGSSIHAMFKQSITFLDSPTIVSGTPITYGVLGWSSGSQAGVCGYNMPENNSTSDSNMGRHMSIITLMEIAQ